MADKQHKRSWRDRFNSAKNKVFNDKTANMAVRLLEIAAAGLTIVAHWPWR